MRLAPRRVASLARGEELPGTRYRLVQWLGEGALGVVYEAHHLDIERRVAFKILRADAAGTAAAEAFRAEARTVSTIGSPNIVEVYDVGELPDGRAWIAMELLDGRALDESIGEPMEPGRAIGILRQVCKGLATAHDAGVVHRDVKPENIVLVSAQGREDTVKLVDFGIAELVGQAGGQAATGTPAYMAPEQIAGESLDPRLDIYGLGCVAYELVSGRLPFDSASVDELLQHHTLSPPPPLHQVAPLVPGPLAQVLLRCLAKRPHERYADMRDLEAALCEAQIEAGLTTPWDDLALPVVEPERLERLRRSMPRRDAATAGRPRWMLPLAAVLGGVVAVLLVLWWTGVLRPGATTEPGEVERLADAARDAAARASYVYPIDGDPHGVTAFLKVVELEALEDDHPEAESTAAELRDDFARTLVQLGDHYWESEESRPYAIDYYAQALLFAPGDEHAGERVLLTPGELATLRQKAIEQTFTARDLEASRPLVALATDDEDERRAQLLQLFEGATRGSMADQRIACLDPSASPLTSKRGKGRQAAASSAAGRSSDDDAERQSEAPQLDASIEGGGEASEEADEAAQSSRRRDPAGARRLAKKGTAAMKAGRTGEAETSFHQALGLDNRNAEALGGLSRVHFNRGAYQRASSFGRRAVRAAPRSAVYRVLLGDALFKLFRYPEAREQYRKAKSLGHGQAMDRLAKVEARISGG